MTGDLLDRADLDTWLARVLLHQGRLARETLSPLLADARAGRSVGGASLARTLVAQGLLRRDEVERLLSEGAEAIAGVEEAPAARPKRLAGYELTEVLGAGGMGVVYRARHLETGVDYALKTLTGADSELVARFQREGEGQARLGDHPNVVKVHSLGREGGICFLVMDLVEGGNLQDRLRGGLPAPEVAARWVLDLAHAVEREHQRGVLHRDLKPANVLFDGDVPLLVDFGLAKLLDARSLTQTGAVMGTPGYMAPEQIDASHGAPSPASDVWGLGAILYHCLTGRAPFRGSSVMATLFQVLEGPPPAPRSFAPDVPTAIEAVCLRCLQKAPQDRYASAAALGEALEAALEADVPVGPRLWVGAVAALVGVAAVAGLAAWAPAERTVPVAASLPLPRATPVRVDPESPEPGWGVRLEGPQAVEVAAIASGAYAGRDRVTEARLLQIASAPPGRVQAIALRLLGRLLIDSVDRRVRDPARGQRMVQRAALAGDAEAAAWIGNAHLPSAASVLSWVRWSPQRPQRVLAHAGLSLAVAWGAQSPAEAACAEALLRVQGLAVLDPRTSYGILWRAFEQARDRLEVPPPGGAAAMWRTKMPAELKARCERHDDYYTARLNDAAAKQQVVQVYHEILRSSPAELHGRALRTLAVLDSVPVVLYLARAALIGDARACIALALTCDRALKADDRTKRFWHKKLKEVPEDVEFATALLVVATQADDWKYSGAARRLLKGRSPQLSPAVSYQMVWRRFPTAR